MTLPDGKPPLWDRICQLYSVARAMPAEERATFLARECVGEADLEREVEILLNISAPPSSFLDSRPDGGNFLRAKTPAGPRCRPGEILNSRFEVVRFLGAGGMGEVYEAIDSELGDSVAVKVLRGYGLPDESLTNRFRREIRLARKITHPNVCRVFDFAQHQTPGGAALYYYVMELLDGETLAQRLTRDKPAIEIAIEIARQMADGLACAHQAGIVHRDFKPGNVMLTKTALGIRAVITDFGLATHADTSLETRSFGSTGMLLGTPGYVAPEQLYGGSITPATDVYAYGIVLHELISGIHPRSPGARSVQMPASWDAAITKAMELDPKLRFASPLDTYAALMPPPKQRWSPSRRQILAAGSVAVAGVALSPLISRFHEERIALTEGALAIVTPTLNTTDDKRFNGLMIGLHASLAQSAHLNIWNSRRLPEVLRSMRLEQSAQLETRTWREIAFREKAPLIVFSSLSKLGAGYVFSIRAERISGTPEQPLRSWDKSFTAAGPESLFEALHSAATWVREMAGENTESLAIRNRLPQDITSANWEALELFQDAQTQSEGGRTSEAIPILRRAVALDPQFAMGFMRLGDLLNSQRKSSEGFQLWKKAIDLAKGQRLSDHERLSLESRYALEVGGYQEAESVLRDWMKKFPHDPLAQQLLAYCLLDLGRYPEGLELATNAEKKFGPSTFGLSTIFAGLAMTSQFARMEQPLAEFEKVAPQALGLQFRGVAAAIRDDYKLAGSYFMKILRIGSSDAVSRGRVLLGMLAADQGLWGEAAHLFEYGIRDDKQSGESGRASRKASALAFVEHARGNAALARAWAREAVSLEPSPRVLTLAACTLCRCGDIDAAQDIDRNFPNDVGLRHEAARWRVKGELAVARGNIGNGLALLERAAQAESALQPKEYLAYARLRSGQPDRARFLYSGLATTPYQIWHSPDSDWPGIRFLARTYLNSK